MLKKARSILLGTGEFHFADGDTILHSELQLATIVLLIETAVSDSQLDKSEVRIICGLLKKAFHLSNDELIELFELAERKKDKMRRLTTFTAQLNRALTPKQRNRLFAMLWTVCLADGHIAQEEAEFAETLRKKLGLSEDEADEAKKKANEMLAA